MNFFTSQQYSFMSLCSLWFPDFPHSYAMSVKEININSWSQTPTTHNIFKFKFIHYCGFKMTKPATLVVKDVQCTFYEKNSTFKHHEETTCFYVCFSFTTSLKFAQSLKLVSHTMQCFHCITFTFHKEKDILFIFILDFAQIWSKAEAVTFRHEIAPQDKQCSQLCILTAYVLPTQLQLQLLKVSLIEVQKTRSHYSCYLMKKLPSVTCICVRLPLIWHDNTLGGLLNTCR